MKKFLSIFIILFVMFWFIISLKSESGTDTRQETDQGNIQKVVTNFRWLDFLKICSNDKCDEQNTKWLRLWSEDSWLEATRSDDSQDYLDNCILYEIEKKWVKTVNISTIPKVVQEEWKIKWDVSILELIKISSGLGNPSLYLSEFDYIAKYPRYLKKFMKNKMVNYAEVDVLQKKWTFNLYLLNCSIYMLPDMMTNSQ
ncbi:MAG: hypothetical protein ACD_71C00114G0011 [uncultured bacterium (gcode 4)]|uniref:Uncharacterized protein n=1 Tax=uncultured bacterium (gcode 4) TaxID=1234023 RepID=K1ZJB1_9BACT|nr:MAG: hypothetical protein ACD_71C00114G0011 [uncultured bacterium (gcode 4)]